MQNKFLSRLLLGALLATSAAMPVFAQNTNTPRIDQAEQDLINRIQQGASAGRISRPEEQDFINRMREIQQWEARFKSDGYASPEERQRLRQNIDALRAEVEATISRPRVVVQQPAVNTPRIDQRETAVRDMIDNGYRNGSLTRDEARNLQRRLLQIQRREARLKSSGRVTPDQRRQLREELDDLRDDINDMIADHRRGVYGR